MGAICSHCEFLSGDGFEDGTCRTAQVVHVSVDTVRNPEFRLISQNYLVGLKMPFRQLIDWCVHGLRDFPGHYRDECGNLIPTPGIACLLTPAAEFWMRDMIEDGKWRTVAEVPRLRSEATGRWRLIGTVRQIYETVQPVCRPSSVMTAT